VLLSKPRSVPWKWNDVKEAHLLEKLLFVPFLLSHPVSSLFKVPDLKRRFGNSRESMMDPGAGPSAGECTFHFMTRGHGCHPLPRRDADSRLQSRFSWSMRDRRAACRSNLFSWLLYVRLRQTYYTPASCLHLHWRQLVWYQG
jgi:hypothetical protein